MVMSPQRPAPDDAEMNTPPNRKPKRKTPNAPIRKPKRVMLSRSPSPALAAAIEAMNVNVGREESE